MFLLEKFCYTINRRIHRVWSFLDRRLRAVVREARAAACDGRNGAEEEDPWPIRGKALYLLFACLLTELTIFFSFGLNFFVFLLAFVVVASYWLSIVFRSVLFLRGLENDLNLKRERCARARILWWGLFQGLYPPFSDRLIEPFYFSPFSVFRVRSHWNLVIWLFCCWIVAFGLLLCVSG